jgi:tetratricopeptide (TPR) repeat protein
MGLFWKKSKAPASGAEPHASEWLDKADSLRQERKYEEALGYYAKALERDPHNGSAWRYVAEALAMCFRYEESVESCERALEINPSNAEVWFLKGFALQMLGNYEEALESSNKGLQIDPGNQVAWCTKGDYLYALGKLEEALESFGTALSIDPESEYAKDIRDKVGKWLQREGRDDAWASKVVAFLERSQHEEATESYKEAVEMDPRDTAVSFTKDFALAHLEKPEKMLEDYERAKRERQPQIRMELSQREFQFGVWTWVEVTLFNEGSGPAKDISLDFAPEFKVQHLEVDPEILSRSREDDTIDTQLISRLEPGNQKNRLISLMPMKAGHSPMDIRISYTGPWKTKHEKMNTVWVSVFRASERLPWIPGYTTLWRLSSGESDDIYAAKRDRDGLTVVIKIPRLAPEQGALATEFLREVKQWSKLKHPNIVRVHHYGDNPSPWMAMEYMEGGPLRRRIGKLSVMEPLQIGISLADALSYAGSLLVIHQDVRPENVLLDNRGVPKLTNWRMKGIKLKLSERTARLKEISAYSAPEAVSLEFGGIDQRTDIYQLGVVLYEMLTGKTPFQGEGETLIEKVKQEQPRRPSELNPAIGKHLDSVVLRCLAKDKEGRYQDGRSLKADLERAAETHGLEDGA